ncbi:MAG: hypothetical protein A2X18_00920 [Bacteroidetes bacterium GWF2_40_14]|nr:MAG: hypothetical protein A2X18_00920 [Bacteroidetes bacterium GWF2_40_14]
MIRYTASKKDRRLNLYDIKKIKIGIFFGIIAGIIDVIPMILQNLTWDANISAFTMWIVVGFLIAAIDLNINLTFVNI